MVERQVLTVAEVARELRVDRRTVYRMIERGQLPAVQAGRLWRIPLEALESYLTVTRRDGVPIGQRGKQNPG